MEFNRNQFFFLGLLILLIGIQFRMISAFVLNEEATRILAKQTGNEAPVAAPLFSLVSSGQAASRHTVEPPEWLGWCLVSVGSVLILHSLAMRRPD